MIKNLSILNLLVIGLLISTIQTSSAQTWEWFQHIKGPSGGGPITLEFDAHNLIDVNQNNESFIVTTPKGPINIMGTNYPSATLFDALYLLKLDSTGNIIWSDILNNSNGSAVPLSLNLDNDGNLYISCSFAGTLENENHSYFSPRRVIMELKYDTDGNIEWHSMISPVGFNSTINVYDRSALAPNGVSYSYNRYDKDVELDGIVYSEITPSSYDSSGLLIKRDASGNTIWVKKIERSNSGFYLDDILVSNDGNIIISGGNRIYNSNGITYNYPGYTNTLNKNIEAYLIKIDANTGDAIWGVSTELAVPSDNTNTLEGIIPIGISMDDAGNLYQLTRLYNEAEDPVSIGNAQISTSDRGYILSKYDNDGNLLFAKEIMTPFQYNIQLETMGDQIIIVSELDTNIIYEGNSLNIVGESDMVFTSYDLDGNFNWVQKYGTTDTDIRTILEVAHGSDGNLFINGFLEPNKMYQYGDISISTDAGQNMYLANFKVNYNPITSIFNPNNQLVNMSVFPNPTTEMVVVKGKLDLEKSAYLNIFDNSGKIIKRERVTQSELSSGKSLLVDGLSNGTYYICIYSDIEMLSAEKLVIQR